MREARPAGAVCIALLADHPAAIPAVAAMRCREWGHPPDLPEWLATTTREAGREALPVTWVALDRDGAALGAVGLLAYDWDDWPERTPWIGGLIVRPDRRDGGIGGLLLAHLAGWARARGHTTVWVATGGRAIRFYERCGWARRGTVPDEAGEVVTLLAKVLTS